MPELSSDEIHIVHTGSFTLSDPARRISSVLTAFEQAVERNPRLRLHLIGRLRDDESAAIQRSSAHLRIDVTGPLPLDQARGWQRAADALLLVAAPDTPHVPGKLAEYRAAGRPIIVTGGGAWLREVGMVAAEDLSAALANVVRHDGGGGAVEAMSPAEASQQLTGILKRAEG